MTALLLIALALAVGLAVLMVVWRLVARAADDRPIQPPPRLPQKKPPTD